MSVGINFELFGILFSLEGRVPNVTRIEVRNTNSSPVVQPSTFHHQVDYLLTSRERSVLKKALQLYAENRQVKIPVE